ncbi:MAG: small ribosomal subunit Rsm22 family protein [Planctomycetota bacterium]
MPPTRAELERIQRLRELFLDEERGERALGDYWRSDDDLAAYDAVLAQRIGWKWDAVLAECRERGWAPDADAVVLDHGCGSGIAARRFAAAFGARTVHCHDRSPRAMAFAARSIPGGVACPHPATVRPDVLLVSHVLGELDPRGEADLRTLIAQSRSVILVEPGSRAVARRLSALRDDLRAEFRLIAPCPHAAACPVLAAPGDGDWCHFFAPPPPEVFTDGEWVRTARAVGIDLRALPYAFVAAARATAPPPTTPPPPKPPERRLGRPTITPHTATLHSCTADGLRTTTIHKRTDPAAWRALKRG